MLAKHSIDKVVVFDNYEILAIEPGHVSLSTIVGKDSLNPYGFAHGGFLFTLCDTVAGAVGLSYNQNCVTQQSSVNYIHSAMVGDTLLVEGKCLHHGKATKVVQVEIHNQENRLIVFSTFTMFIIQ